MKTQNNITKVVAAILAGTLLAGCAGTPRNDTGDGYGMFYDGESTATYATAFPVGTPEEAYRNGDMSLRSGDADRALFEYIRGLRLAKEPSPDALYRIGYIHHKRENYRLADLAYRWVLEMAPNHAQAGTGLGEVLLQKRQYKAAEEQLRAVTIAHGQAPWRAYNALGIIADMNGNAEQAEQYYQKALSINPESAVVLNNLGYSRYLFGNWAGANEALQSALQADPSYELAWRNLGLVHARQGDYGYALEALGRNGQPAEALNDVGFVSMMSGDYDQALTFFEEAMRLSPAYYVTASENASNVRRMLERRGGIGL
ncbi:tetratricopeptide repeat protein [Modicisalibacter xianhensis]|uniref:Tetratricopeptide repeat protein n=1 Tax=Modicisalibacter xianhensis TaxID=442341 RepID=A0A4R8FWG4_9GAMM|nr:tetratricopeptide repeat protein [Halomonas xianhensis]TDX28411.1 tetratricopeptide repeat protein [Halomonas xianhensis]